MDSSTRIGTSKYAAENQLVAVIGDEDTVVGFLMGGIGETNKDREVNFFVVDNDTKVSAIENSIKKFATRNDIAVIFITSTVADKVRDMLDRQMYHDKIVLDIPSKDHPFEASKDTFLIRAAQHMHRGDDV